jgi:hypothetical protein
VPAEPLKILDVSWSGIRAGDHDRNTTPNIGSMDDECGPLRKRAIAERLCAVETMTIGGVFMKSTVVKRSISVAGHKTSRACHASARGRAMTDDQRIEALEQALRECAEAALDRIEALEELLVECTEVLIARGGHGELVARIRHLLDEEPPPARRRNGS